MSVTPAKSRRRNAKAPAEPEGFACEFCKRSFSRESAFLVHMCGQKQRFLDRDLPHVRLAFAVYQRFYQLSYGAKRATAKSYEDFARSPYYAAFVRFGRYVRSMNVVAWEAFVDYLIRGAVKLDRWESPVIYEAYIRDLNRRESADAAIERNILLMQQWSIDTGEAWVDFFRKVPTTLATQWIRSGRISPWVLYTAPSATDLFSRMSDEQLTLIESYIDPSFWKAKLDRHIDDVESIKAILKEAGC